VGIAGPWSQALSFNIAPLSAPTSVGPSGQTNNLLPTFTWNAVAGADHYDLWVDDSTAGTSQVMRMQNVSGTSFTTAAPLTVGHTYQWWVRAITNRGTRGLWSQGAMFSEVIAGTPAPLGPKANVGADATFTWSAAVAADHYDLWVNDVTSGQGQVLRNQAIIGTSWQPAQPLKIGDSYRWWVRALSSTGTAGAWSGAVDFTVMAFPPPTLLAVTGPAAAPTFSWSAVANADHYDLWVDDLTTGQSQVVRAAHVVGTAFIASPLIQGHSYQWWVRAFDGSGTASLWSAAG
jgi:predicted phage tail protein